MGSALFVSWDSLYLRWFSSSREIHLQCMVEIGRLEGRCPGKRQTWRVNWTEVGAYTLIRMTVGRFGALQNVPDMMRYRERKELQFQSRDGFQNDRRLSSFFIWLHREQETKNFNVTRPYLNRLCHRNGAKPTPLSHKRYNRLVLRLIQSYYPIPGGTSSTSSLTTTAPPQKNLTWYAGLRLKMLHLESISKAKTQATKSAKNFSKPEMDEVIQNWSCRPQYIGQNGTFGEATTPYLH